MKAARIILLLAALSGIHATGQELSQAVLPAGGGLKDPSQLAPGVELRAGKGDDQVTLKLSRYVSEPEGQLLPNGDRLARFSTGSLLFSTPLSKRNTTELLTLDGLATGSSVAFQYSSFSASFRPALATERAAKDQICAVVLKKKQAKEDKKASDPKAEQPIECDSSDVEKYGTPKQQKDWERLSWGDAAMPPQIWGASAEVGFPTHDYVNTDTLAKESSKEHPWSVGAYYALSPDRSNTIYSISAKYQRSYEDGKEGVLCPVVAPTGVSSVSCASGALGATVRKTKKLLAFDVRHDFGNVAVGLTITRDFAQPATSVELPLYLIKNSDGKLNGGLKFGYRSDTKQYGAGVFVGSAFSIYQ
ncbi:hypothetical protein [Duganella hordei]|uniref:hypothetical protein n=1 Tax=Duganella hordei TaxID=2865934 RepID=UPI0030E90C32